MRKVLYFTILVLLGVYLTHAKTDKSETVAYFKENRSAITDLIEHYSGLNAHQPFSFGYLDNKYQDFLIQVYTDSVRYVYKSGVTIDQKFPEIQKISVDTAALRALAQKVQQAHAIWIESRDIYLSGFHQKGTVISFQPQRINSPFTPTRFLTLLVMDEGQEIALSEEELAKFQIYPIQKGVYHTISNQFR